MATTSYIVLVCTPPDNESADDSITWEEWGSINASSAAAATRAAAEKSGDGRYVAIPSRSWQPATFKVQPRAIEVKP